jgi:hypothetical protein
MNKLAMSIYKKQASLLLPKAVAAATTGRKLGLSASSLAAIETANIILRAQHAKNELIGAALASGNSSGAREALGSSIHDRILDNKLSDLINNSFLMSPIESGKYLLGLK